MMKKLFSILWLLIVCAYVNAQSFYFTDNSNRWLFHYLYSPGGATTYHNYWSYQYSDSAVSIDGFDYKVLQKTNISGEANVALLREDTINGKIFMRTLWPTLGSGTGSVVVSTTEEFLFMDYNLQVGDSFMLPFVSTVPPPFFDDSASIHVVYLVDSILIDDFYHKRWYFNSVSGYYYSTNNMFIQGVGGSHDFFLSPSYSVGPTTRANLVCFISNEQNPIASLQSCNNFPTTITASSPVLSNALTVFPNPATTSIDVSVGERKNHNPLRLSIVDVLGSEVVRQFMQGSSIKIDIGKLPTGLYLVIVEGENETRLCKRFCITK